MIILSKPKSSYMRAFIVAAALIVAIPVNAETLRVGTSGQANPFTFVQQGVLQGFDIDVINAIAEITGDDVEFLTMPSPSLIGALDANRVDTVANQVTVTSEREEKYLFSQPYVVDGAQVVVRKEDEATIRSVADLKGRSVGVILGSNYEDLLKELPYADEIDIRTYETNILEHEVALGRIDALVRDRVSAVRVLDQVSLPLTLAGEPFAPLYDAYPFRDNDKGRADVVKFNNALKVLRENGKLTELSQKWFGRDVTN